MQLKKKGQQVTLGNLSTIALSIGFAILLMSALALGLNSFRETQCTGYWSGTGCFNNVSLNFESGATLAHNISRTGQTSLSNVTTQLPVVGTMIGVVLIITVLGAMFVGRRNK